MVRFKYFVFFLLLSLNLELLSQVYPVSTVDSLLKEGITHIVNQEYDKAEIYFYTLNNKYPELPLGNIYLAANKIAKAYDHSVEFDNDFIYRNLEFAKEKTLKLLEKDDANIWHLYFYALAEGYAAYFDALNENWLSAFSTGYNSISSFEECLSIKNNFYESYIAISTYAYWKSRKTEFLNWLPFMNDDREFAIDKLKAAADSASYNRYLAINSLFWIYIDKKNYREAINVSKKALGEFPQSRIFKWGLARAYEEVDTIAAIKIYYEILNSYPSIESTNRINEITLKHIIAQQYNKLGEHKMALTLCDEILSINNLSEFAKSKLKERIERVNQLKADILKQYK